jgi:starch-binding outer membrane protein, SusD/RagB family
MTIMKKVFWKIYTASVLFSGLMTAGCSDDFLDRPPLDTIVDATYYKTNEQALAGSAPLYNIVWFEYNDKASHGLGDGRGGVLTTGSYQLENVLFATTGVTQENTNAWNAFYNVVAQSNMLIYNINNYRGEEVTEDVRKHVIAEARFMRGLAYSFLVQNWGAVPIITNNLNLLGDTTVAPNTVESVWEFITRDLRYATENLPATPKLPGRLTSFAAKGMLAKMYLTRAGVGATEGNRNQVFLDSARILAKDVIDNSGAFLLSPATGYPGGYEDLFKMKNNNNPETIVALQWIYNHQNYTQWGAQNTVQSFLAFSPSITGFGDGWGGDLSASWYMLDKYEGLLDNGSTPDKRLKATFMLPGMHYDYIHQAVDDPVTGDPVEVELTVPTGGEGFNTRAWVKKYVVGRPIDNEGKVLQQGNEMQTYMLRLAEVYLIYAEAVLGNNGSDNGEALAAVNIVRDRAGLDPLTSVTWDDIFNERHLELAMEGQMWYDFLRLHYYNPEKAEALLSSQERGFFNITPDDEEEATEWTFELTQSRKVNVTSGNFLLPIPERELSMAPNLKKTPVPYAF